MKRYWEKIDKTLVIVIMTGSLLLIPPLNMTHYFQNNFAQAANDFEGSNGKRQSISSIEPLPDLPEVPDVPGKAGKLNMFKLLADLPKGPRFKGQKTLEKMLPPSTTVSEVPRIEPPSARPISTKASGLVDVRKYGFTEASIKKAIEINQGKGTLYFSSGTWRINNNFTIPEQMSVKIDNGASLSIAKGATFLISGPLVDCLWQIFDDENTENSKGVKLARNAVSHVRPEWWGLKNKGNAKTNGTALTKALNCSTTGKAEIAVLFSPGEFTFNDTIQLTPFCHLKGQKTVLALASGTNKYFLEGNKIDGPVIENLNIIGGYNDADCIYIHGGHAGGIRNCFFETSGLGKTRYTIRMAPQNQMKVENCSFLAVNGIFAGNIDGWVRSCEIQGPGYGFSNVGIKAAEGPLVHDCIIYGFARGIDTSGQMLIYGNRIDQCTIGINGGKENILSGMPYIVPTSPPYNVTVSPRDWAFKDYGVMTQRAYFNDDTIHLTRVPADPGPGQYTVTDVPNGGTYTFNKSEAGKKLFFNYQHAIESGGAGCDAQIIANRLSSSIVGIKTWSGAPTIAGNIFTEFKCGGNAIAVMAFGPGGLATANKFIDNNRNILADANGAPLECHDNMGIDLAQDVGTISTKVSGDLPEVYAGPLWETANHSPTNINAMKAAADGHKIALIVNKNTTLQKYWVPSDIYLTADNNVTFRAAASNNRNFSGQKDFNYFQGPKDGEIIYFGDNTRFNSLQFHIKENVAAKTLMFNWEYATPWGWIPAWDQVPAWEPHKAYPAGKVVKPASGTSPLIYISQNRGTSGSAEPPWKRIFNGEYHPYAVIKDNNIAWLPFYPLQVNNPQALQVGGTGQIEVWFTPPPSTCWALVNPRNFSDGNFPGGTKFWLRCRLSGVTEGTNGGSNNAQAVKKCNIRLSTETFNPPLKGVLNLIYHNHSWIEVGRRLL